MHNVPAPQNVRATVAAVRVVVNAVPVAGTSLGVVAENLCKGWAELEANDELHIVLRPGVGLPRPALPGAR